MDNLPEDLIHSEYFSYRSKIDLLDEHYEDLLDDLSGYLGNPFYELKTVNNSKGDIFFYWQGPFPKASYMQRVEVYLERVLENNSVGLLTNYIFSEPLTVEEICKKSPNIEIYKNLINAVHKDGNSFIVGGVEENYSKRVRFWISKSDPVKYDNVEIIAYFELPTRYKVSDIDFDYKLRQRILNNSDSTEYENLPDKEFFDLQMKKFNLEFENKMNTSLTNFGNEYKVDIIHGRKQYTWRKAYTFDFQCSYVLEVADGEEGIGYTESWILNTPLKLTELKKYFPILVNPPDEIKKAPMGNKVFIYNKIEKIGATIKNFAFTRDLFPKIHIITSSNYFYLPKKFTKASQN